MYTVQEQAQHAIKTCETFRDVEEKALALALERYPDEPAVHAALRESIAYQNKLIEGYKKQAED